jgi:molybdopterin converting factor small subunit
MKINVRFAGFYRSLAGLSTLTLELAEGATVEEAIQLINERLDGRLNEVFYRGNLSETHPDLLILVDTKISSRETVLHESCVLAFVPPMAGGSL